MSRLQQAISTQPVTQLKVAPTATESSAIASVQAKWFLRYRMQLASYLMYACGVHAALCEKTVIAALYLNLA